jgi:hypothetical protein
VVYATGLTLHCIAYSTLESKEKTMKKLILALMLVALGCAGNSEYEHFDCPAEATCFDEGEIVPAEYTGTGEPMVAEGFLISYEMNRDAAPAIAPPYMPEGKDTVDKYYVFHKELGSKVPRGRTLLVVKQIDSNVDWNLLQLNGGLTESNTTPMITDALNHVFQLQQAFSFWWEDVPPVPHSTVRVRYRTSNGNLLGETKCTVAVILLVPWGGGGNRFVCMNYDADIYLHTWMDECLDNSCGVTLKENVTRTIMHEVVHTLGVKHENNSVEGDQNPGHNNWYIDGRGTRSLMSQNPRKSGKRPSLTDCHWQMAYTFINDMAGQHHNAWSPATYGLTIPGPGNYCHSGHGHMPNVHPTDE